MKVRDLTAFRIAHLAPESQLVVVHRRDDVAADALADATSQADGDATATVAYQSIHGGVLTAPEEIYRLLDTVLEQRLPAVFAPLDEREHWEDFDEDADPLPAGPGPYGSGVRGLGSAGGRIDLTAGPDPDPTSVPVDDDEDGGYIDHDMDDDAPRSREPWREVSGDRSHLLPWLVGRMRWSMNDGPYTEYPKNPEEYAALEETHATRRELADRLMTAFPPEHSRYFIGAHAGWDRWHENYLDRDEVIAFVSADRIAVLWLAFFRFYG